MIQLQFHNSISIIHSCDEPRYQDEFFITATYLGVIHCSYEFFKQRASTNTDDRYSDKS